MSQLAFYILDVFAEQKYAGNQLAVFRRAAGLTHDEMQRIAPTSLARVASTSASSLPARKSRLPVIRRWGPPTSSGTRFLAAKRTR